MLAAEQRATGSTEVPFSRRAPWLRLRGAIALSEGRDDEALELFGEVVGSPESPAAPRAAALRALLQLPMEARRSEPLANVIEIALDRGEALPAALRGEAWLRLADLRRAQGQARAAHYAYRRASELLPRGAARSRCLHALASAAATREERVVLLSSLIDEEKRGAWTELARSELRLAHLRELVDRSERSAR